MSMLGEMTGARVEPTARPVAAARAGATWEERIRTAAIVIGRLGLAYLFFTQLFWKLPPTFGCPADFRFTTAGPNGQLVRSSGLCDWIGIESAWASRPRQLLVTDVGGGLKLGVPVEPVVKLNGAFIDGFVQPNIRWFGWLIWGAEAFIALSLGLGLFSRLGGLIALAVAGQLTIGLAGIGNPYEWEWSYLQIMLLAVLMIGLAPGRHFGLDARLRPRLAEAAAAGNRAARFALMLT